MRKLNSKKIGLYSPFATETPGGGERYFLEVAECLLKAGHQVDFVISPKVSTNVKDLSNLKASYQKVFNLDIKNLQFITGPFGEKDSSWQRWQFSRNYDAFYYLTDGSFFISGSKKNLVHFMIPFKSPKGGLVNRLKLNFWPIKVTNSHFTKKILEKNWGIKVNYVHGGVVDTRVFRPDKKKTIIVNVGRFISLEDNKHCKRQDLLVKVFKRMCDQGLKNWELWLVGPISKGRDNYEYAKKVRSTAKNYQIQVKHDLEFSKLVSIYGKAKIYWHATGFGIDEWQHPEMMEHLGITTIEAMAAGCVPVVINKAGQKEIVTDKKNGLLWETEEELNQKTLQVVKSESLRTRLQKAAQKRAQDYSKEKFYQETLRIFDL